MMILRSLNTYVIDKVWRILQKKGNQKKMIEIEKKKLYAHSNNSIKFKLISAGGDINQGGTTET